MSVEINTEQFASEVQAKAAENSGTQTNQAADPSSIEDAHRVYVGNINFKVTEDVLRELFSSAGQIVSIALPSRRNFRTNGRQPQGIAFIGFADDKEAQKAVETLNGHELQDRQIQVAMARPMAERKPRIQKVKDVETDKAASHTDGESPGASGDSATPVAEQADAVQSSADGAEVAQKKPKRKPKKKASGTKEGTGSPQATQAAEPNAQAESTPDATEAPKVNGAAKSTVKKAPREKGPPQNGTPSTTTLFVAGLSYECTDDELKSFFTEYNPVSAHVALRPINRFMIRKLAERKEPRKGRGFGFVTFSTEQDQQQALEKMNGHEVDERQLEVKVAVDAPPKAEPESASAKTPSQPQAVETDPIAS